MFKHIKVGDGVIRNLGGLKMLLQVTSVDEEFIYCGGRGLKDIDSWKFCRATGAEIDEELGWDQYGTGSYLEEEEEEKNN